MLEAIHHTVDPSGERETRGQWRQEGRAINPETPWKFTQMGVKLNSFMDYIYFGGSWITLAALSVLVLNNAHEVLSVLSSEGVCWILFGA